jgi:hypothetical protein
MKNYHKLNYKIDNILCFLYNKHYFFLLDSIDKDGYIHIFNEKKGYEMNIVAKKCDDNKNNTSNITIIYDNPVKLTIPKSSTNLKIIVSCVTYNLIPGTSISNVITYKELFSSKHSLTKYNELFNPNRDNMYIEKDIIDMHYNQIGPTPTSAPTSVNTNKDYLHIVNTKIMDGIIVNRKQIDKLNKENWGRNGVGGGYSHKGLKVIVENTNKNEFMLIVIIHIGSIELGIEIINKFIKMGNKNSDNNKNGNNYNYLFCFNMNEDICKNEAIIKLIEKFSNFIITSTINYGNDIVPSILAYNYINSKYKFEYILKIQTKNKKSWFDGNINILVIKSLDLVLALLTNSNIDSIGAERFLTKMDDYNTDIINKYLPYDSLGVIPIISKLSNKYFIKIIDKIILHLPKDFNCDNYKKNNYHVFKDRNISNYELIKHYLKEGYNKNYSYKNRSNNITFFAGTMFLCKKKIFDNMNTTYHKIINASIINNFYYDNIIFKNVSPVHALERLFGYTYNNFAITNYKKPIIYASFLHSNGKGNNIKNALDKLFDKLLITNIINKDDIVHQHFLNINKIYKSTKDDSNDNDNKYILLITDAHNPKTNANTNANYNANANTNAPDITNAPNTPDITNANTNAPDITNAPNTPDISYIHNLLHFNTYTFISYGESQEPYYHFPINKMWIIKYNLINEFIETYKRDDKLFLLNFSNIILNKYDYYCL